MSKTTTVTSTTYCTREECQGHVTTRTYPGRLVLTNDPARPLAIDTDEES